MFIKFALLAFIIFVGFRFLNFINKAWQYVRYIKYHVNYILPIFELFTWICLVVWFVSMVFQSENYNGLIVLAILFTIFVIPAFYLIRDFVFGIYLKMQRRLEKGDYIEFDKTEGEILDSRHFNLEIKDKHGYIKTIPYSKIKSRIIAKQGTNPNLKRQILVFRFQKQTEINKIKLELEKSLLNAPWIAVSHPPVIESMKMLNGEQIFKVAVFTLKKEYAENIRELVEKNLSLG